MNQITLVSGWVFCSLLICGYICIYPFFTTHYCMCLFIYIYIYVCIYVCFYMCVYGNVYLEMDLHSQTRAREWWWCWPFRPKRGRGLSSLTSSGSAGGRWSSSWGLSGLGLLMYRRTDSCHDNMRYVWLFVWLFCFLGQLYLDNGSSHCSTYAIRWLCLVNCVMWRVCAAGCAREWVVLIIVGYRELIT